MINRSGLVYVAGHRGLVGSAIWRHLEKQGFTRLIGVSSAELDLRDRAATEAFLERHRPDVVIDAAARVGGILANDRHPAEFLSDNLRIQLNLMDAAHDVGVERLLFLGSSCIYPRLAEQPIAESSLLTGPLEPTNDAYAIAKIAGIMQVQAHRRQYGARWISAMPTNLYGPGDKFHPGVSHVIPALIKKCVDAIDRGDDHIEVWGTGSASREFLFVDDAAEGIVAAAERYDGADPVNLGANREMPIRELVDHVVAATGFSGEVRWDTSKPDGQPRRQVDASRAKAEFGFEASTPFDEGLARTVDWYLAHRSEAEAREL